MVGSMVALGIATPFAGWKRRGGCNPSDWSEGLSVSPGDWPLPRYKGCPYRILSLSQRRNNQFFFFCGAITGHEAASFDGEEHEMAERVKDAEGRGPGLEPPWLVQWSRWESRPLSLVGNGARAVTLD